MTEQDRKELARKLMYGEITMTEWVKEMKKFENKKSKDWWHMTPKEAGVIL